MAVTDRAPLRIALIGNPNTGKSTLFSAVSGVAQRTGNYPGVTVEKKIGVSQHHGRTIEWIDLPGTYSLVPRSPDEWVAVDVLVGRQTGEPMPDAIVCVVDASNLERNLFLLTQLLDLERPVVLALNMIDSAQCHGIKVDAAKLSQRLGIPVVPTQAHRGQGIQELIAAAVSAAGAPAGGERVPFPEIVESWEQRLAKRLASSGLVVEPFPRFLRHRLLLQTDSETTRRIVGAGLASEVAPWLVESSQALQAAGIASASVEPMTRYAWISERLDGVVERSERSSAATWSDRLDRVLVHKVWGTAIFVLLMGLVFQTIFAGAEPLMGAIETGIGWVGEQVASMMPDGVLESLVVDGVIAGVGGVLVFLPQIMILFGFIAILEDCGYMARAAFLMDRLMARIGLNGKAFIPLLSSFACAIPGVMATRTIENRRDRFITMLVAPLMSCSARLPVYTLLIAAFIPDQTWAGGWIGLQGLTLFSMYALGVVVAIVVALVLRTTLFRGETTPFLLELPSFKFPSLKVVVLRMVDRGMAFVKRAGTLILAVTVLVWAAASFPVDAAKEAAHAERVAALEARGEAGAEVLAEAETLRQAERLRESALGQAGIAIEPLVKPLGWDWKIGCAVIASFPAREVVIGTMGVIYQLGADEDESSESLRESLQAATWDGTDRKVFSVPVALSLMVFFSLCAQCASTLVIIGRETSSWRWPIFTFVYMTTLAYLAAWATYQIGSRL